ncbi:MULTISPECIES: phage tail spike protein [unclassified Facklamia]|uniref:phage tail spike protein n=1 Tax=Aerococcaceae TaxID=186827 RepID=UPI0013B9AB97|nr:MULTISPECIES: phage tail spike protein [unclassified Facklamia]NEW64248.1 peptidase [Facklamia sp. 252]NEW68763.1 peptidase [Facklamia sp. 253]QQD64715.1 phage tail protein [Aerococcaceae bacterium zg-252]
MKPILFNANEKTFTTYGLGEIDAISAVVTRERNGNYSLYMEYPINGEMASIFEKEMKVKADAGVRTKNQTFEISRIIKDTSSRKIKIHAKHISHKTEHLAVKVNAKVNGDATAALVAWKNNLIGDFQFDVWSDITTVNSTQWNVQNIQNARLALGGASGSILDVWGGEYEFDNTTIKLHKELGRKTPTVLEYGRNILSAEADIDIESTYTAIYPYTIYTTQESNEEKIITLPELIIEGAFANNFANKRILTVDFSTSFKENETPTEEKLRKLAQRYVKNNRIGEPKIKTKISYIDLSTTLDYADMKIMEEVELCDRLPIYYPTIGITSDNAKVNTIEYDVLLERNISVEIGSVGTSLRSAIADDVATRLNQIENSVKKQSQAELPPYLINGKGNRIWFSTPDPNMEHKVDDIWFEQNGKYTRMKRWNGEMWEVLIDTETFELELAKKFKQVEDHLKTTEAEIEKIHARNEEELEKFREELKSLDLSEEKIEAITKKINLELLDFDALKSQIESVRESSRVNAEMIGNDGKPRYSKNILIGEVDRKLLFTDDHITIEANDGGFKKGQTYTISFEALCELLAKAKVNFNFGREAVRGVTITLTPSSSKLTTVQTGSKTVDVLPGDYTVLMTSGWYKRYSQEVRIEKDTTIDILTEYREIAEGNRTMAYQGEWSENPELILDGGVS